MSHRVYRFTDDECTCSLGDPVAGARTLRVLKMSGTEAVLEPEGGLSEEQFVYSTVELRDGPSFALSGVVIASTAKGVTVQWTHDSPREADRIDATLRTYVERLEGGEEAEGGSSAGEGTGAVAATPAPEPAASPAPGDAPPRPSGSSTTASGEPARPGSEPVARGADRRHGSRTASRQRGTSPGTRGGAERERPARSGERRPGRHRIRPLVKQGGSGSPSDEMAPGGPGATEAGAPPETPADTAAREAAHREGQVDVEAAILRRARTVRSADLASRLDTVQVLNMSTIQTLIEQAVNDAAERLDSHLRDEEKRRLFEEAEQGFRERLETFQAEKAGLEAHTKNLQEQLDRAQETLDEERKRVVEANQFTVSDAGMVELEQKFGRMLDRAVKAGHVGGDLEHDLRQVVQALLDDERDKIREQAQQAQNDRISLLEKKVGRLATTLDETSRERDRARQRAAALEAQGGVPVRNVVEAGLADDDPAREKKLSLLREIMDYNREVRRGLADAGRMPPPRRRAASGESASPDSAPRGTASRDTPSLESASREAASQESASKKSASGEPASRGTGTPGGATEPLSGPPAPDGAGPEAAQEAPAGPGDDAGHDRNAGDGPEVPETATAGAGAPGGDPEEDESPPRAPQDADDDEDTEAVLANGPEEEDVDPDDRIWEPGQGAARPAGSAAFRRLG